MGGLRKNNRERKKTACTTVCWVGVGVRKVEKCIKGKNGDGKIKLKIYENTSKTLEKFLGGEPGKVKKGKLEKLSHSRRD